jgi:cation diffusion facilitator CzcD-associated flavoprotein CzcO
MAAGSPSARVCVIGAGPCGLTTVKNLLAEGIDFICYEEAPAVGGNWVYDDSADRRSVYKATRLISSKRLSEFEDFPMPEDYPDFPSHRQMLDYFNAYAKRFNLLPKIVLNTRVMSAKRRPLCRRPNCRRRSPARVGRRTARAVCTRANAASHP